MIRFTVNKGAYNKDVDASQLQSGWANVEKDLDYLQKAVKAGAAWCATWFTGKYRKGSNADGSNAIVFDIDGDCTLDQFWATGTAQFWCALTYTSCNHAESEHRFRAIFPLAGQLDSRERHQAAYDELASRLLNDLGLEGFKDDSGRNPERLWFGNTAAVFQENTKVTPVPLELIPEPAAKQERAAGEMGDIDLERCEYILRHILHPSEDGEYSTKYVRVLTAVASIGHEIEEAWVDWVSRGHHGSKPQNLSTSKWEGLSVGTFATLYAMAKEQDPDWKQQLPEHLRSFDTGTTTGDAKGYMKAAADPCPDFSGLSQAGNDAVVAVDPQPVAPPADTSSKRGRPKKSNDDYAQQRNDDVRLVQEVFPNIRLNTLTNQIEYDQNGQKTIIQGSDLSFMTNRLCWFHGKYIPENRVNSAINFAASLNAYCPIKDVYLKDVVKLDPHPEWHRIGEIFLGNSDPIATLTLQRLMIGAVNRILNPGSSMSWLPILVGAQGVGKSMFSRSLVPEEFFVEMTAPLETLSKEQYRLHMGWLLELPEIDHYFSSKNIENFKNLVTTRIDETRYPYNPKPDKLPRKFVLIGTTNRNQFLVDTTGNRRFVPLEIKQNFQVPWKKLQAERDQLWSAAMAAHGRNERYEFTAGEIADISEYIQAFNDPDPWVEKIVRYIEDRAEVKAADVLTHALELDPRSQSRREGRRVAEVLQSLGWRRQCTSRTDKKTGKTKSVRLWIRPENDPLPEDQTGEF